MKNLCKNMAFGSLVFLLSGMVDASLQNVNTQVDYSQIVMNKTECCSKLNQILEGDENLNVTCFFSFSFENGKLCLEIKGCEDSKEQFINWLYTAKLSKETLNILGELAGIPYQNPMFLPDNRHAIFIVLLSWIFNDQTVKNKETATRTTLNELGVSQWDKERLYGTNVHLGQTNVFELKKYQELMQDRKKLRRLLSILDHNKTSNFLMTLDNVTTDEQFLGLSWNLNEEENVRDLFSVFCTLRNHFTSTNTTLNRGIAQLFNEHRENEMINIVYPLPVINGRQVTEDEARQHFQQNPHQ